MGRCRLAPATVRLWPGGGLTEGSRTPMAICSDYAEPSTAAEPDRSAAPCRSTIPAGAEVVAEFRGQLAAEDAPSGLADVVADADKVDVSGLTGIEDDVPRVRVRVLRPADAFGVHEVNAIHLAAPRYVGVPRSR